MCNKYSACVVHVKTYIGIRVFLSGKIIQTVECRPTKNIDVDLFWECWL